MTRFQSHSDHSPCNPMPLLEIAARHLLAEHGERALTLAWAASRNKRAQGDFAKSKIWQDIHAVLTARLVAPSATVAASLN